MKEEINNPKFIKEDKDGVQSDERRIYQNLDHRHSVNGQPTFSKTSQVHVARVGNIITRKYGRGIVRRILMSSDDAAVNDGRDEKDQEYRTCEQKPGGPIKRFNETVEDRSSRGGYIGPWVPSNNHEGVVEDGCNNMKATYMLRNFEKEARDPQFTTIVYPRVDKIHQGIERDCPCTIIRHTRKHAIRVCRTAL